MNIILERIRALSEIQPDQTAFVSMDESGQMSETSCRALQIQVHEAANLLISLQIRALALRADNSLNWAIIDLAAMAADVVIVPVPTFFSGSQVAHILQVSAVDALAGNWEDLDDQFTEAEDTAHVLAGLPLIRLKVSRPASFPVGTGKITFTSGSTGQPRGVCLANDSLCNIANSLVRAVGHHSARHMVMLPLSTLLENITGIYVPLLSGVPAWIMPGTYTGLIGASQLDIHAFASALATILPQSLVLTPALLQALVHIVRQSPEIACPLGFVAVGGAKVPGPLLKAAHELGIPVYEGYGLSESGSVVSLNTPAADRPGTCGKPLPHIQVRIADDSELLVRGSTALGYLDAPFKSPWLATGDLAELDKDGFIRLTGRKKNLIVTAFGRNVSPEWIESEAYAFMPQHLCIVTGDGQSGLCVLVENHANAEAAITKLNWTLPDYARIQVLLLIDQLRAIPGWYTSNGKPRRPDIERDVAQWLLNPTPGQTLAGQRTRRVNIPQQSLTT
jgi:long-subunit acyl-CoA synthetase (AMP-forming)